MRFANVFKKNLLLVVVTATIFSFCIGQSAFADGSLVGWGRDDNGQATPPAGNYVAISAGLYYSLALKSDGTIVGWGQLQATPPAGNYVAISAGYYHSLALKSDGSIVGWGLNDDGQATPPAGNYVAISAGGFHSLALKSDGTIVGWGNNGYGQATPPAGNYVAISTGQLHSLALKSDGSIVGWGSNEWGQATPPAGNYVAISAGGYHSLALKSDGSIVGWGYNVYGQATPPAGNYVTISAGLWHSLALKSDGSIVGWGRNDYGQATPPAGNYVAISAGGHHSLAIWGTQPQLSLIDPNGGETLLTGWRYTISWQSQGYISGVLIEYSDDNGASWTPVNPLNVGNTGSYNWLVPEVTSDQCLVRVSSTPYGWTVSDVSNTVFKMYKCRLADVTGDCVVDFFDFALMAADWLKCGDPFDSNCVQ
jgi:hypothetical protein